jgi:hypothetical protein
MPHKRSQRPKSQMKTLGATIANLSWALAGVLIGILLFLALAYSWPWLECRVGDIAGFKDVCAAPKGIEERPPGAWGNFLAAGGWAQALFAFATLLVAGIALSQVKELKEQTKIQRDRAEADTYRVLISDRMVSIKRFVRHPKVSEAFSWLLTETQKLPPLPHKPTDAEVKCQKGEFQFLLDETRRRIARAAKLVSLPLLGRAASLDDIEAMINEYNFLSKLILEDRLNERFITDLGIKNFGDIYDQVKPFIDARQILSPSYASHFQTYKVRAAASNKR